MLKRVEAKVPQAAFPAKEAASYLGVSESTIWRMLRAGTLTGIKLRGRTVVSRAACDALLAQTAAE